MNRAVLSFLCLLAILQEACGARFNVMGHVDEEQRIRLKSQYDLEPGGILMLPIDVPEESISFYGLAVPRISEIDRSSGDGVYGTGDTILLD
jgi:hypothetical protein